MRGSPRSDQAPIDAERQLGLAESQNVEQLAVAPACRDDGAASSGAVTGSADRFSPVQYSSSNRRRQGTWFGVRTTTSRTVLPTRIGPRNV
jgi:hypothetical protein